MTTYAARNLLSRITLEDAVTASKALEAAAIKYRGIAADGNAHPAHVRIYIDRAVSCERVAAALVSGARVD